MMRAKNPRCRETRQAWALLGVLTLCLLAALPLFAEAPASGAWEALSSPEGLDLRDGLNRPISRESLQREIKAGFRRAGRAASLSRRERILSDALERFKALFPVWTPPALGRHLDIPGLILDPPKPYILCALLWFGMSLVSTLGFFSMTCDAVRPVQTTPLVLRC